MSISMKKSSLFIIRDVASLYLGNFFLLLRRRRVRGCFTNVSRALQNNLAKIHNTENHIYGENFKLKLCTCAQSHALGTRTKFQLEILIRTAISEIHKFQENILESLRNISETNARLLRFQLKCLRYLSPSLLKAQEQKIIKQVFDSRGLVLFIETNKAKYTLSSHCPHMISSTNTHNIVLFACFVLFSNITFVTVLSNDNTELFSHKLHRLSAMIQMNKYNI